MHGTKGALALSAWRVLVEAMSQRRPAGTIGLAEVPGFDAAGLRACILY